MATIKGFQMKNIKYTRGMEGVGFIATMYLHGKKIGTYADYGNGACGNDEYISKEAEAEMMRVIIEHAKEFPNGYIVSFYKDSPDMYEKECQRFKEHHPYIADEDITVETMSANSIEYIVDAFLKLHDLEQQFKKNQKKGYRAMSVNEEGRIAYPDCWTDEEIRNHAKDAVLYMSLEDFCK